MKLGLLVTTLASVFAVSAQASDLQVNFSASPAIVIPSPTNTLSCSQIATGAKYFVGDVQGAYFTFPTPEISWNGPANQSTVRVQAIVLKIKNDKVGDYKCVHTDEALNNLFFKRNSVGENIIVQTWKGQLGGRFTDDAVTSTTNLESMGFDSCMLKCGNLNIAADAGAFTAEGTWDVYAVETRYDNDSNVMSQIPHKVSGKFTIDNVLE